MEPLVDENQLMEIKKAFTINRYRDDEKILHVSYTLSNEAFN